METNELAHPYQTKELCLREGEVYSDGGFTHTALATRNSDDVTDML